MISLPDEVDNYIHALITLWLSKWVREFDREMMELYGECDE